MEESVYRNKLILSIVLISCIAFSQRNSLSDVVPAGKSLDEILTAVERANNAFKTLKADITFTRTITLLESSEVSQGEMSYKNPRDCI